MSSTPASKLGWFVDFIKENPLISAWNAILLFGGCTLLFFHANLTYLPDFNLSDLAGLLASITFTGLLFIAGVMFTCVLPGLSLRWMEKAWADPTGKYFETPGQKIYLVLFGIISWVAYLALPPAILENTPILPAPFYFFIQIGLTSLIIAMTMAFHKSHTWPMPIWKNTWMWQRTTALFLWIILLVFPIEMATIFASSGETKTEMFFAVIIALFLIIFNGAVYLAPAVQYVYALGGGALLIVVVFPIIIGQSLLMPKAVMQVLALGNRNAATITLEGKQCHALARFGIVCDAEDIDHGAVDLQNVNILSRIGTSVLLELLVEQTEDDSSPNAATGPHLQRSTFDILRISQNERTRYCPTSSRLSGVCGRCDEILVQRIVPAKESGPITKTRNPYAESKQRENLETYRNKLVCVQISIPKDNILNVSYSGKRQYAGFSSFSLLPKLDGDTVKGVKP